MADLCSLSALLFWTGIFVLASSSTAAPEPPQCSYTVTHNKFVLKIEVKPPGDYNITVFEEDQTGTEEKIQVHNSSVWQSDPLKPCTEYSHHVSFNDGGKEIFCNAQKNKTRTDPMSEGDVKEQYCIPEHVCYQSEWDLSSSIQTPDNLPVIRCRNDKKTFCVRPANKHICSDLTITFTSGACVNSYFIFTKSISVDFLNSSEIYQIKSTGLPAKIEATLPELPKCGNLSVSYTCSENVFDKKNLSQNLSELEPFTDYSCTGLILKNNIPTNKKTPAVQFRVNCDLTITNIKKNPSNTSIELSWKTTSEKCKDVLQNFSYDCSCQRKDQKNGQKQVTGTKRPSDEGTCNITGLDPYTDYTCQVKPKYKNHDVTRYATGTEDHLRTKSGIPEAVTGLKLTVPEHNTIRVTWSRPSRFNGPEKKYRVLLKKAGDAQLESKTLDLACTKCEFEFKDLSDSTAYTVEVTVFNGHYESLPQEKHVDTFYNSYVPITVLRVFFTITPLTLMLVVCKIYILRCIKSETKAEFNSHHSEEPHYGAASPF